MEKIVFKYHPQQEDWEFAVAAALGLDFPGVLLDELERQHLDWRTFTAFPNGFTYELMVRAFFRTQIRDLSMKQLDASGEAERWEITVTRKERARLLAGFKETIRMLVWEPSGGKGAGVPGPDVYSCTLC